MRNKNEDFHDTLGLLMHKQSYHNVQALRSHKHLLKRLEMLRHVTKNLKTEFFPDIKESSDIKKYYPFEAVFRKLRETLSHQNA